MKKIKKSVFYLKDDFKLNSYIYIYIEKFIIHNINCSNTCRIACLCIGIYVYFVVFVSLFLYITFFIFILFKHVCLILN